MIYFNILHFAVGDEVIGQIKYRISNTDDTNVTDWDGL